MHVCGISLHGQVPNIDILNRSNNLSVECQLPGKRLRSLGHCFRMPDDRLPKKLLFGEVKGLRPPGRPRSIDNVTLHDIKTVVLSGLIGMHKTGCSEETRPVLLVRSSS